MPDCLTAHLATCRMESWAALWGLQACFQKKVAHGIYTGKDINLYLYPKVPLQLWALGGADCSRFQWHPYTFCFVSLCGYLVLIELLLQGHCNKMEFLLCGTAWRLLTSLYWLLHCFIIFIHNYMICLQIDIRTCFLIYVSLCVEPIFRLTINLQPNVFIVILLPCMWCKCWSFRFLLPLWQAFLELSMSLCCLFQSQARGFLSLTRFNASCREWFCG